MDARQKAKELYNKYKDIIMQSDKYNYLLYDEESLFAKQAALIAVDIKLESAYWQHKDYVGEDKNIEQTEEFWNEVKTEIER